MERRVVQVVGDGVNGRWLTWRWADALASGGVHETSCLDEWAGQLRAALPTPDAHGLTGVRLDGPLTRADEELRLSSGLASALLPERLCEQLLDCQRNSIRVQVRVAPSPAAAAVPWGLLPLDADTRLLDIADISWIAPVLPRDLRPETDHPDWTRVRALPALHVLDPKTANGHKAVLGHDNDLARQLRVTKGTSQQPYTRTDLSNDLHAGTSRLFLLGHCISSGSAGDTGFLLSDGSDAGESGQRQFPGPLTAADLLRGTLPDGVPGHLVGRRPWPMPPRVAVVACASGADLTDHEPFGFATALLINGADTVQATLWPLPTDVSLKLADPTAGPALTELAIAIDAAQTADDPVAALCEWQRCKLNAWRTAPCLGDAPIVWAAAMTMTAPVRSHDPHSNRTLAPSPSDDSEPST